MSEKHPFDYQQPSQEQIKKIEEVRAKCKELYELLHTIPSSRYRSVSITKLEEVSMWANKAIVFE